MTMEAGSGRGRCKWLVNRRCVPQYILITCTSRISHRSAPPVAFVYHCAGMHACRGLELRSNGSAWWGGGVRVGISPRFLLLCGVCGAPGGGHGGGVKVYKKSKYSTLVPPPPPRACTNKLSNPPLLRPNSQFQAKSRKKSPMDFLNNVAKQVQGAAGGHNYGNQNQSDQGTYGAPPPREYDQQHTQNIADRLVNFVDGGASARERQRQEEAQRLAEAEIERKRERREQEGFIGGIKNMWDGGADAEEKRLQEERERRRREEEEAGVFGKVQGLMGLKQEEERPQSVGDKILGAFGKQQKKPDMVDHSELMSPCNDV